MRDLETTIWNLMASVKLNLESGVVEPQIDLHMFLPRDIPNVVADYVTAAHGAGLREVRLVHGRGRGIQRGIVQQALDRHPLVAEFWDDTSSHLGATWCRLVEGGLS